MVKRHKIFILQASDETPQLGHPPDSAQKVDPCLLRILWSVFEISADKKSEDYMLQTIVLMLGMIEGRWGHPLLQLNDEPSTRLA